MQGMDAAKTGKMIKAQSSAFISPHTDAVEQPIRRKKNIYSKHRTNEPNKWIGGGGKMKYTGHKVRGSRRTKINPAWLEWKYNININGNKEGKMIKAKKGIFHGAASSMYDKPPGWDVKKISDKTHKKLTKLWKHREAGGWSPAGGKKYRAHLKTLKKLTTKPSTFLERRFKLGLAGPAKLPFAKSAKNLIKTVGVFPKVKSKSFHFKDTPDPSKFLERRKVLAGGKSLTSVLKKVGKRTGIGKAIAAATVVAGAYEAGKRKLFSLEKPSKEKIKKKVDKKSIGGETVVMKSGGGYIDDLI